MSFPMQQQQMDQWCWAAVAAGLSCYFTPAASLTQCQVAGGALHQDCCFDPDACDVPKQLQTALEVLRQRTAAGPRKLTFPAPSGPLTFNDLKKENDHGLPVCIRIGWDDGSGHFAVVCGSERLPSGAEIVEIADPFYGEGTLDFDELCSAYLGSGQWTNAYRVRVK